jgi:hypothetical protein
VVGERSTTVTRPTRVPALTWELRASGGVRADAASEFCQRVGNHDVCSVGREAGDVAGRAVARFAGALLAGAPGSWGGAGNDERVALEYVAVLERRVRELGGSLERWPDEPLPSEPVSG